MTTPGRVSQWLIEARRCFEAIDAESVAAAAAALLAVRDEGGTIFTAGNGGSATTASHLALDLQKAGRAPSGRGTRAVALSDSVALLTAWGNDTAFDRVFAEQLEVMAEPGDALIVISVSGSSPNLVALVGAARRLGLVTLGLLGRDGGALRAELDHAVIVPSHDYGWVETAHVLLHHVLTYAVREAASTPLAAAPRGHRNG